MSSTITDRYESMVKEVVEARRADRGFKRAQAEAATLFGITVRRVRACLYGEVRSVEASEWITVRSRFLTHLDAEAARLDQKAALIRARRAAMREEAA